MPYGLLGKYLPITSHNSPKLVPVWYPRGTAERMPRAKLTDAAVQRYKAAPGERIDYFDAILPGFALRVSGPTVRKPSGSKSWVLMYRYGGIKKRLTIEPGYPAMGLADARQQAREALQRLGRREDPALTRKLAEQKARDDARNTVEAVIDQFMTRYMQAKKRAPRYIAETRGNFDRHVLPAWRGRPLANITRRDVIDLLDKIADQGRQTAADDKPQKHRIGGPIAANRVLAAISKLFNWAISRDIIENSPVIKIGKPSGETKRDRVLDDREIRLIWKASEALPYPKGPYFRLLMATAQRREETATMRWRDIQSDAVWMIPAEANKPDRTHAVPLSALALHVLSDCPERGSHVFTSRSRRGARLGDTEVDAPLSGYSKAKAELDEIVAKLAIETGEQPPAPWTIHDLRRTAATVMGKLGVTRFIQKRVLNHADNDVTGIYDRYEYLAEKRVALEKWGAYLGGLSLS
jgi:integrase